MSGLTVRTCAKVNLSLRVLSRRRDGFHNVETVMHTVGIWDTLRLQPRETGIELRVEGEHTPVGESNLCWQAANLLAARAKATRGVTILLDKAIPVGAGLGGGSSDAAAVLVGLSQLWETGLTLEALERLGAELGSDVPFFLRGGCCLGLGRGEKLQTLPPVALPMVVVVPDRRVPTAQAYAALRRGASLSPRRSLSRATQRMVQAVTAGDAGAIAAALHNDFEALEMAAIADSLEAKAALLEAGCSGALLSGSGSAVFGLARDEAAAVEIAAALQERWGWVRATATARIARIAAPAGGEEQVP